jgi:hypothetical protein
MFVIASTGRCGTTALCRGLDMFSDHTVWHEPEPRLLREAYLKHRGEDFRSEALEWALSFFRSRAPKKFGQSFRAPNLLHEVHSAVPRARFLIIVRPPLEYIASANAMRAFRRDDDWDRTRIVPEEAYPSLKDAPLAQKLAWHWTAVNDHLLDFAATTGTPVAELGRLQQQVPDWAETLGVQVVDAAGLRVFLASRPNAAVDKRLPEGTDLDRVLETVGPTWERVQTLSS